MRDKIYLVFTVLYLFARIASSQKYDYVWAGGDNPPGDNFTINFLSLPPTVTKINLPFVFGADNLSISDSVGRFLFYSNGCLVRNFQRSIISGAEIINNGSKQQRDCKEIGNYWFIEQSLFALPQPNNIFYLFHLRLEDDNASKSLLFSKLDMKANGGAGRMLFRDSVLLRGSFQVACANRHANGRDWWILLTDNAAGRFYRLLLTPVGLQGPWEQDIENPTAQNVWYYGWSLFSPDGRYFAAHHGYFGAVLYDFDRCTGLLGNMRFLRRNPNESNSNWNYGLTFSPNSRFLYVYIDGSKKIVQYDLSSINFIASGVVVGDRDVSEIFVPLGYLHTGPDGKVYIWSSNRTYVNTIEMPNRKGLDCQVRFHTISLPTYTNPGHNLYYPNYRLGPVDGSACDTLGLDNRPEALFRHDLEDTLSALRITFTDLSYYEPAEWHWDFGDPASGAANMSRDTNPVHTFSAPGLYTVCLIVKNQYAADTFCRQVSVGVVDAVENLPLSPRISVAPNPFSQSFRVLLPALMPGTRARFALYDALGRRLHETALTDFETDIPAADLPPGAYYWVFSVNGQAVQQGRCVKMR